LRGEGEREGSRSQDRLGREERSRDGHSPRDINTKIPVDDVRGGDGIEDVGGCWDKPRGGCWEEGEGIREEIQITMMDAD